MTLMVHDLCDVLLGKSRKRPLLLLDAHTPTLQKDLVARTTCMLAARKFDFGVLPLEPMDAHTWHAPKLEETEWGFWRDGLVPLPFEVCWYEFTLGNSRSGLLLIDRGTEWHIERYDWSSEVLYDGVTVHAILAHAGTPGGVRISGTMRAVELLQRQDMALIERDYVSCANLAVYMTLMLNSKTTETRAERVPPAANAARRALGRTPQQDHHVITIVPKRFVASTTAHGHGVGGGKALHWRRSHLRHYEQHTPRSQWQPSVEHNGRTGWWVAVIPRHLVGRAELGEVTHDYRVKP